MNKNAIIWIIVIIIALVLVFSLRGGKNENEKTSSGTAPNTNQSGTVGESPPETSDAIIEDELLNFDSTQEEDDSVILSDETIISEPSE
ncbi:hypothetical protein HYW75_00505 [Candidatus Pacearchaeota archaeon]|nr:hypothetical protein [Candidatus Pacearchaeota archaeon]